MKIETAIALFILQITFFAGVQWAVTRAAIAQQRKDLNGLGEKARQAELKLFYVAMMLCPDDDPHLRQEILNALVRKLT